MFRPSRFLPLAFGMPRPLNVLFLSSEVEPFAKTGGLADVSGALPKAVKRLGNEIRVMMPRYGSINERRSHLHAMLRLNEVSVPVDRKRYQASVRSSFIVDNHTKVQVYFLDNPPLFGRHGIYIHPDTKKDYPDNDARFTFFARGVLEVLKVMGWQPHIIHCNDWPTGLVPAYLKTLYRDDPFYRDTKTVFTIHNMAYQGVFPGSSFAKTLLPFGAFSGKGVEAFGNLNFLKAGLVYSDALTTVSEKYAREIQSSDEYGCGLQGVVRKRREDLVGILNGVDYTVWDPAVDRLIPQRYDMRSLDLKIENKKVLCEQLGLPFDRSIPLIGIISRLAGQKGFDLIGKAMDSLMQLDLQLAVLGTGEKQYHDMFTKAARKYPRKLAVRLTFNEELAHLIEAGGDMFLMPSRYEPCGLNQIYSLRYATVPIVRATGGLDDTVEDFHPSSLRGTGFKFKKYDGAELVKSVKRALRVFGNDGAWRALMKNGMVKDFSWESSARKYVHLYRSLAKE